MLSWLVFIAGEIVSVWKFWRYKNESYDMKEYERFIHQCNMLVPFIDMGQEEVFKLFEDNYQQWHSFRSDSLPEAINTFDSFVRNINHSAYVLGYAYFEAYLGDLVKVILMQYPKKMSKNKNMTFSEIIELTDYAAVLEAMVKKEIGQLFAGGMKSIIAYFEKPINLNWPEGKSSPAIECSLIRNCIVHNSSVVSEQLAREFPRWNLGDEISLSTGDVHDSGLNVRDIAASLDEQASRLLESK